MIFLPIIINTNEDKCSDYGHQRKDVTHRVKKNKENLPPDAFHGALKLFVKICINANPNNWSPM